MSGVYQNWLKVQNPNMSNDIIPMRSGGSQKPFYFGGSQVLSSLDLEDNVKGTGVYKKINMMPENIKGKGLITTDFRKNTNIHIPRKLKM